jgi:hypothetical protein
VSVVAFVLVAGALMIACSSRELPSADVTDSGDRADSAVLDTTVPPEAHVDSGSADEAGEDASIPDVPCSETPAEDRACCEGAFVCSAKYACTCGFMTSDCTRCSGGRWQPIINDDCFFACRDSGAPAGDGG